MWDPYAEFEKETLPNGLSIYVAHWPKVSWEHVGFVVHSGAEQDLANLEGTAHFVEHLVSANADITEEEIREFFENCGGGVDFGTTDHQCTTYNFLAPADTVILSQAFSIFSQMLLSAKLKKLKERERRIIIREFWEYYKYMVNFELHLRETRALFGGNWPSKFIDVVGYPESINRITKEDLQRYYDINYTPHNISIVCLGGMKPNEIIEIISKSPFSIYKNGERTPLPSYAADIPLPSENRYLFETSKHFLTPKPIMYGSYKSVALIPGDVSASIEILVEMADKILYEKIRQLSAWTYKVKCEGENYRYFHQFSIESKLSPKAMDTIENIVDDSIASLTDREDLFEKVRRYTIAENQIKDIDGSTVLEESMDNLGCFHRIISLTGHIKELQALTMQDIRGMLRWISKERRWTLIKKP